MLPEADFLYYADEEHVPYGEKTREQVRGYIDEIIAFMIKKQVDAKCTVQNRQPTHARVKNTYFHDVTPRTMNVPWHNQAVLSL